MLGEARDTVTVIHAVWRVWVKVHSIPTSWRLQMPVSCRVVVAMVHAKEEWVRRGERARPQPMHGQDAPQTRGGDASGHHGGNGEQVRWQLAGKGAG